MDDITPAPPIKGKTPEGGASKKYKYIGPAAGAKGKSLAYPGPLLITPSKMTDEQIAALEKSNPLLFRRLWAVNS